MQSFVLSTFAQYTINKLKLRAASLSLSSTKTSLSVRLLQPGLNACYNSTHHLMTIITSYIAIKETMIHRFILWKNSTNTNVFRSKLNDGFLYINEMKNFNVSEINPYIHDLANLKKPIQVKTFVKDKLNFLNFSSNRQYSTSSSELGILEKQANSNLEDPVVQERFFEKLHEHQHHDIVVERFENVNFYANGECFKIYVEALVNLGMTQDLAEKCLVAIKKHPNLQNEIPQIKDKLNEKINIFSNKSYENNTKKIYSNAINSLAGDKNKPIHVVVQEATNFDFWKVFRKAGFTLFYIFFIFTFLSLILENSGLIKGNQQQNNYESDQTSTVKFEDVQGADEAKEELQEIVDFLKNPQKFVQLGGKLPKGVLLVGPPGTGKTLLARAVAGEAQVPFLLMSGSEFDEMYVGVGAKRVRDLFAAAKKKAPSIIFIDEIDAVGSKRNPKDQTYIKQTLNQLLVELDGFTQTEGVVLIAATNFPQSLDKALIRPGRFDRHINVSLPDVRGRIQILKLHSKKISIDKMVDLAKVARGTPGFSGADLANLINLAALQASRKGKLRVGNEEFEFAKDRIIMGAERRSAVITEKDKFITAYHEGGHALVAYYTKGAIPLHKATILPRGQSLGMTVQLPEMDKTNYTKMEYQAMLDVCMGGRVAEELIYGKENVTSGAHNDLQKATDVARSMVIEMGMNDKLGPVDYSNNYEQLSHSTKMLIENEIKQTLTESYQRVMNLMKSRKKELKRIADALIENETLTFEQIQKSINGEKL